MIARSKVSYSLHVSLVILVVIIVFTMIFIMFKGIERQGVLNDFCEEQGFSSWSFAEGLGRDVFACREKGTINYFVYEDGGKTIYPLDTGGASE